MEDQLQLGRLCPWSGRSRSQSLGEHCFKGNKKEQGMFPKSYRVVAGLGAQCVVSGLQITV